MIYHLLYNSNILSNQGYERNIKIILIGTITYIILKYVLIFLVGNKSFIRFLYYIAVIDLLYILWEQKNKYVNDLKLDGKYNLIDEIKDYFNLNEKKIVNNIDKLSKKNLNNKIKNELNKLINNELIVESKYTNISENNHINDIKNNNNIDIVSNDNSSFYESIDIPIYKSEKKDTSIRTNEIDTEIDTDSESNYIPIYRSRKKQNQKKEVFNFEV